MHYLNFRGCKLNLNDFNKEFYSLAEKISLYMGIIISFAKQLKVGVYKALTL